MIAILALMLTACAQQQPSDTTTRTIHATRMFDGVAMRDDVLVTIRGARIVAVQPYTTQRVTYDLRGRTLLPGLIDVHVHEAWYINKRGKLHTPGDGDSDADVRDGLLGNLHATLRAGFTTVQTLGGEAEAELRALAQQDSLAPRVLASIEPISLPQSIDALRAHVGRLVQEHADVVKVFAPDDVERNTMEARELLRELQSICTDAHEQHLRVIVHAHADYAQQALSQAHCDEGEHGLFATRATLRTLAAAHTLFDPQCSLVFANYARNRAVFEGIAGYDAATFDWLAKMAPHAVEVTNWALQTSGLIVPYGTDAVAGAHGHNAEDLVCRVRQAHEPAIDALKAATSIAAQSLDLSSQIGRIAPGLLADLVAVDGDPATTIEAVEHVAWIMRNGRVVRP